MRAAEDAIASPGADEEADDEGLFAGDMRLSRGR